MLIIYSLSVYSLVTLPSFIQKDAQLPQFSLWNSYSGPQKETTVIMSGRAQSCQPRTS